MSNSDSEKDEKFDGLELAQEVKNQMDRGGVSKFQQETEFDDQTRIIIAAIKHGGASQSTSETQLGQLSESDHDTVSSAEYSLAEVIITSFMLNPHVQKVIVELMLPAVLVSASMLSSQGIDSKNSVNINSGGDIYIENVTISDDDVSISPVGLRSEEDNKDE